MTISIAKKKFFVSLLLTIFSAVVILILWIIAAKKINSNLVMPHPNEVLQSFFKLSAQKIFWQQVLFTVARSFSAFLISLFFSLIIGILCGLFSFVEKFLSLPLVFIKTAPVVSFILPALFWFSTNTVPIFVSVLMTLPIMTSAVTTGIQNADVQLLQMAKFFNLNKKQMIKYIYVPSMKSYFFSSATTSFAQSWKVVIASEVISLPKVASGTALYMAKVHLETADVFAISIFIIFISFVCERIVAQIFRRLSN